MTGDDWLAVAAFAGLVAFVFAVDGLRRRELRRHQRHVDEVEHRRLLDEIRGHS
jgi:hypothetical protein